LQCSIMETITFLAELYSMKVRGRANELNHLLLNVLIIWVCFFLYQVLWLDKPKHNVKLDRPVLAAVLAVGLVACMSFPIPFYPKYPFDLSGVLLMIGGLYGGLNAGLALAVIIVLFRVAQGVGGIGTTVIIVFLAWASIAVMIRHYSFFSMKRKLLAGALLAGGIGTSVIGVVYLLMLDYHSGISVQALLHIVSFGFLNAASAYMSVYFIEKMRENGLMQAEIQQREKMQMLGELAASVAHEIRNPMTVVRGFMQLMSGHSSSLKRFHEYAPMIIEELDRAESILSDYLSFAKPQEAAWERLDLTEQLANAVSMVTPHANMHRVEIRTYWQTSLTICFDREKLKQLMMNLMKNGIEAMPDGGTLDLELYREGDDAVIRILDTGVGMTQEELNRLGSLFYSTKTKGTGIGIMICYKIIEAANGSLQLASEKAKGTTVTVRLPLAIDKVTEETK